MAVLLSNLSARVPKTDDLEAIARLIIACDIAEYGMPDCTIEHLLSDWQGSEFNLETDAWVIVTMRGEFVGYACVWRKPSTDVYMYTCVHPEYRGRGIGTLLLRLCEERARQHMRQVPGGTRVALNSTVSDVNVAAGRLLEREGYTIVRSFWRIAIKLDESYRKSYWRRRLKIDLDVDSKCINGAAQHDEHDGIYIIRQYNTYEKELRAGELIQQEMKPIPQEVAG